MAESQPQAAFATLAKSVQFEWSYLQRILPNLMRSILSFQEQLLFSFPARMGGMGIHNPVDTAKVNYTTSRAGTSNIVDAIKGSKN